MTITLSKPIAIIILICLSIIVVCDIALMFLKWYQKRLNNQEKKIVDTIGKYEKELNKTNSTFLAGKGLKGRHTEVIIPNEIDYMLDEEILQRKIADMRGEE